MPSTLFVCTTNLCRSPLASVFLRQIVAHGVYSSTWRIESAGTWATEGLPAVPEAQKVAHEHGLDLGTHRSRCISADLLRPFNLVLTMEQGHQEALRIEFPDVAERVYMLSETAGVRANILDPIPGSLPDCRRVAREIEEWLRLGYGKIVDLALGQPVAQARRAP